MQNIYYATRSYVDDSPNSIYIKSHLRTQFASTLMYSVDRLDKSSSMNPRISEDRSFFDPSPSTGFGGMFTNFILSTSTRNPHPTVRLPSSPLVSLLLRAAHVARPGDAQLAGDAKLRARGRSADHIARVTARTRRTVAGWCGWWLEWMVFWMVFWMVLCVGRVADGGWMVWTSCVDLCGERSFREFSVGL